jgi:hypothetical protein
MAISPRLRRLPYFGAYSGCEIPVRTGQEALPAFDFKWRLLTSSATRFRGE